MPIQGILIGPDAVAYWGLQQFDNSGADEAARQASAQSWLDLADTVPAENIMDLTDNMDSDMADSTTRAEAKLGWSAEIAVLKNGQVQFDFRWENGPTANDPFTAALIAAWNNRSGISMAFMDQPAKTTDATKALGLGAVFSVSISKQENLRDIQKASATLTVAKNPLWITTNN